MQFAWSNCATRVAGALLLQNKFINLFNINLLQAFYDMLLYINQNGQCTPTIHSVKNKKIKYVVSSLLSSSCVMFKLKYVY